MVSIAANPKLGWPKNYVVFWHVWPQHAVVDGELRQVGFEVELMGCHCLDPNHLDPGCPLCRHVRAVLLAIGEHAAQSTLQTGEDSVRYEIDCHSTSVVVAPQLGNRPCVTVSIMISGKDAARPVAGVSETLAVKEITRYLAGMGILER